MKHMKSSARDQPEHEQPTSHTVQGGMKCQKLGLQNNPIFHFSTQKDTRNTPELVSSILYSYIRLSWSSTFHGPKQLISTASSLGEPFRTWLFQARSQRSKSTLLAMEAGRIETHVSMDVFNAR